MIPPMIPHLSLYLTFSLLVSLFFHNSHLYFHKFFYILSEILVSSVRFHIYACILHTYRAPQMDFSSFFIYFVKFSVYFVMGFCGNLFKRNSRLNCENVKKHFVYNDKFTLNVLDLRQIDLATDEDKAYKLDSRN